MCTIHHHLCLKGRTDCSNLIDLVGILDIRDDHLCFRDIDPVFKILGSQHGGCRDVYCSDLDKGNNHEPPFRHPVEHDKNPVSFADLVLDHHIDDLVGSLGDVAECKELLLSLLVSPDHRNLVAVLPCPGINHIKSEVKILRHFYPEIPIGLIIILNIMTMWCRRVINNRA